MAQRGLNPNPSGGRQVARTSNDPLSAFQRLFGDAFRQLSEVNETVPVIAPRIDVSETDQAILVRAELPGVDLNDIEVMIDEDLLTIRGEKEVERDTDRENFHVVERAVGAFARTVRLPFPVDPTSVQADFENGVLTITLPKPAASRQRRQRIDVRGSNRQSQSRSDADTSGQSAAGQSASGQGTSGQGAAGQSLGDAADAMRSAEAKQAAGGEPGRKESSRQSR